MIISTIISLVCFIIVVLEFFIIYKFLKSCINVACTVTSSEKVEERVDGYLVSEYWNTTVSYNINGNEKTDNLKTSTFCPKGQTIYCYYAPKKDNLFRKRDFKKQIHSSTYVVISIGTLFMVLNLIFNLVSIDNILKINISIALLTFLIVSFLGMGIGWVLYSVFAIKNTQKNRVVVTKAVISDITRSTAKNKENKTYTYYPIYTYNFQGEKHEVKSRIGRKTSPKKGSNVKILVDKKKGGPVEYKDIGKSMLLGITFIVLGITTLLVLILM